MRGEGGEGEGGRRVNYIKMRDGVNGRLHWFIGSVSMPLQCSHSLFGNAVFHHCRCDTIAVKAFLCS